MFLTLDCLQASFQFTFLPLSLPLIFTTEEFDSPRPPFYLRAMRVRVDPCRRATCRSSKGQRPRRSSARCSPARMPQAQQQRSWRRRTDVTVVDSACVPWRCSVGFFSQAPLTRLIWGPATGAGDPGHGARRNANEVALVRLGQ